MGMRSTVEHLKPENNQFGNPFGTEIALFRTSEGGMARMAVSWDTPGAGGERGRIRTEKGTFYGEFQNGEKDAALPAIARPPLPPGVAAGGHVIGLDDRRVRVGSRELHRIQASRGGSADGDAGNPGGS